MLNENFTFNYFEIAMTFRNSILINAILSSLEATNFLTKSHIGTLHECDIYLMSRLFLSGSKSPVLGYFWETGAMPIEFLLMGRRMMYLFEIMTKKNSSELVRSVVDM